MPMPPYHHHQQQQQFSQQQQFQPSAAPPPRPPPAPAPPPARSLSEINEALLRVSDDLIEGRGDTAFLKQERLRLQAAKAAAEINEALLRVCNDLIEGRGDPAFLKQERLRLQAAKAAAESGGGGGGSGGNGSGGGRASSFGAVSVSQQFQQQQQSFPAPPAPPSSYSFEHGGGGIGGGVGGSHHLGGNNNIDNNKNFTSSAAPFPASSSSFAQGASSLIGGGNGNFPAPLLDPTTGERIPDPSLRAPLGPPSASANERVCVAVDGTADPAWAREDFPWSAAARSANKDYFGNSKFRYHQLMAINASLAGKDVFVLMPTGGGKSLCYQLPALLSPGVTVVVSPLVSLIQDQVYHLGEAGVACGFLSAAQPYEETRRIMDDLRCSPPALKVLFVTPEKVAKSDAIMRAFDDLNARGHLVSFLAS